MLRALPEWREVSRHVARGAWAAADAPLLRVEALARQFAVEELPLVLALRGAGSFHRGHFAAAADAWSEVDSDAARHLARWARAEGSDVAEDLGQAPAGGAEVDGQDDAGFGAAAVPASWADRVRFERRIVQALERAEYALDRGEEVDSTLGRLFWIVYPPESTRPRKPVDPWKLFGHCFTPFRESLKMP